MISKLFKYWKKSKQQKAAKLAIKLVNTLNEIGRESASGGKAESVTIYEYSHVDDLLALSVISPIRIEIEFNHKGKIVK